MVWTGETIVPGINGHALLHPSVEKKNVAAVLL